MPYARCWLNEEEDADVVAALEAASNQSAFIREALRAKVRGIAEDGAASVRTNVPGDADIVAALREIAGAVRALQAEAPVHQPVAEDPDAVRRLGGMF